MNNDTVKEKRFSIGHFLFVNAIYLVLWLGILTGIATAFGERSIYFPLILMILPLFLSLRILLTWNKSRKRDFIFLGIVVAFTFSLISIGIYGAISDDFYQFSKIVRNNTNFRNIEIHPEPEAGVGRGVNYIRGTVDTVEDFMQLKSLTVKYEISGIDNIRLSKTDDEEIDSSL